MQPYSPLSPLRYKRLFQHITRMPNLVAYYPMFEQSGTVCKNYAPATRGTLNGTITGAGLGFAGKAGKSYSFDGANDSVNLGDIPAINDATALTFFAFTNFNNVTQDHYIFGNVASGTSGIFFFADDVASTSGRTDTFKLLIQEDAGSGATAAALEGSTNANAAGVWKMVAFTFSANTTGGLKLYVNGVEDAQSPINTTNIANVGLSNGSLTIGESPTGTLDANAYMQHIGVVTRALSSTEILKLARVGGVA